MKFGDLPVLPSQASSTAGSVDFAALAVLAVCLFFGLGVLVVMITLLIRYRSGNVVDRTNPPLSLDWLEWSWIALPTVLSLGLFGLGARTYLQLYQMPNNVSVIDVVGQQWMWEVYYPNGRREHNALHVPLHRKTELRMISQDVIHSFFVPDFRVKHDVLPGRYTYLWFEPTEVGDFHLFCSEFCGTSHAVMGGFVHVMSDEDYQKWLNDPSQDHLPSHSGGPQEGLPPNTERPDPYNLPDGALTQAQRGDRLFHQVGCAQCHEGITVSAPRLQGVYGRNVTLEDNTEVVADEDYLRTSILYPQKQIVSGFGAIMPTYDKHLKEAQVLDLIAYIRSLGAAK